MKTLKLRKITAGVALAISSTFLQAAPLDLDTSFDGDGMLVADYAAVIGGQSLLQDVEITPDEKIIAVGFAQNAGAPVTYNLLLSQYNLDGTPDSNFGTNGVVNVAVESNARGSALVVQPDGKILVTGHSKGASNKWRLFVKRFNADGSEDTSFTEYNYAPSYTYLNTSGVRDVFGKDIALTQNGKILVSAQEHFYSFATGAGSNDLKRSRMIRLQNNGSLDTSFGSGGFTDKRDFSSADSFSYEDEKFALSSAGDIYVSGGRQEAFFSQHNQTMTLSKFNASGSAQSFDGSNEGWNRRSNYVFSNQTASPYADRLYSSVVLPNGNVVSAGCIDSGTYFKSRIQQQDSAGSFITAFSGDGIIDSTMSTQSQRIAHCYRDINYHPGVGLIAVGGIKNGPFSSHGSLYVSTIDEITGAGIGLQRLGTVNEGYLYATATTSAGKIVSVGYMNNPKEAVVIVMEGAPLPAPVNTLNPFTFTNVTDAALSASQTASSSVVITPSAALTASVFGGSAEINSTAVSNPITLNDGDTLDLEHTSAATESTMTTTGIVVNNGAGYHRNNQMWKVGDTFSQFNSTTLVIDTTPDAFSFTSNTDVAFNTLQLSNIIAVSGINASTPISVAQGDYSINGGAFTNAAGSVENGDTIQLRHASSGTFGGLSATILTIGGVFNDFRSIVEALDTVPESFSFAAVGNVELTTQTESSSFAVAGINYQTPISIIGGEYKLGSGAYTSAAGFVHSGDVVTVRHTSSNAPSTIISSTLTIGGVTADFESTTEAADTTPDAFVLATPTGYPVDSYATSQITVSGINSAAPISIANGEYRVGTSAYTSANGTVNNGDVVVVRHTTSSNFSSPMTSTLNIGGVTGDFISTTTAQDTTPDAFSFTPRNNASLNASVQAGGFLVSGINDATPISITGGEYKIGINGAFTSANGMVNNGDFVTVRHITSSNFNSTVTSSLTIGGVIGHYVSTTVAQDTTPDVFGFGPRLNVSLDDTIQAGFNVTGIDNGTPISIVGGEYRIGNGQFTSANGTVNNGDLIGIRHTASSNFNSTVTSSLTIGTVTETFSSTTETADNTPDTFTFANQAGVELSTELISASITVLGINTEAQVTISAGEYSINGGTFTSAVGIVESGDEVKVRHTSAASNETATVTELTIGGVVGQFTTTTKAAASTGNGGTGTGTEAELNPKSSSGGGSMGGALLILSGLLFWRRRTQ